MYSYNLQSHIRFGSVLIIFFLSLHSNAENPKKKSNDDIRNELIKKYSVPIGKPVHHWKAPADAGKFKEIVTDYGIKISYPICYDFEVPEGVSKEKVSTSAAVTFLKTKFCPGWKSEGINEFTFYRDYTTKNGDIAKMGLGDELYRESISIQGVSGHLYVRLNYGIANGARDAQPNVSYDLRLICKINNESFYYYAMLSAGYGEESWRILKSQDFSVPADVKEILSTFKCVKPKVKYK